VERVMNSGPVTVGSKDSLDAAYSLMRRQTHLRSLPVVEQDGRVVGVKSLEEVLDLGDHDNWVVLMAGGFGKRLRPLTDSVPKPLLKIGDRPVLETTIDTLVKHGFRRFFIAVHYRADMIKAYFGTGERWGIHIEYLHEHKALGTSGALSLLPAKPERPILVMNADLVTKVNYLQLLDFHREHEPAATMCVREYNHRIPFGVLQVDEYRIVALEEKPVQRYLVNAGIYVLDPNSIELIPHGEYFDMTDLFNRLLQDGRETAVFPVREYWTDIGMLDDFDRANGDYNHHFSEDR